MANYNVRLHFAELPSSTNSLDFFGGNIYAPEKLSSGEYELIGTWGSTSVTITRSYYLEGSYHLSGYIAITLTELVGRDYTGYEYILLAPTSSDWKVKKYMALPIRWIRYGSDGIADIQPAFSDFEML